LGASAPAPAPAAAAEESMDVDAGAFPEEVIEKMDKTSAEYEHNVILVNLAKSNFFRIDFLPIAVVRRSLQ